MKIDSFGSTSTESLKPIKLSDRGETGTQKSSLNVPGTSKEDHTTLSYGSDPVQSLTVSALETSHSRHQMISTLKKAVDTGRYQPNPAHIADALSSTEI